MRRVVDLSRDILGLLRDHKADLVGVEIVPGTVAGRLDVCATLIDGREIVLARGLTRDTANDIADEAKLAVLAIRSGAEYPPADMPIPRHSTGPIERAQCAALLESTRESFTRIGSGFEGVRYKSASAPFADVLARFKARHAQPATPAVPDFRGVPLMTIARERMVSRAQWLAIGAVYPERLQTVHWRSVNHPRQSVHFTRDRRRTLCNLQIPASTAALVVYGTRAGAADDCRRCVTAAERQSVWGVEP